MLSFVSVFFVYSAFLSRSSFRSKWDSITTGAFHFRLACPLALLDYSELTPPDPKSCVQLGGTSRESRPNMRLLAVEQLRKIENDALEVNFVSFSLCLHW